MRSPSGRQACKPGSGGWISAGFALLTLLVASCGRKPAAAPAKLPEFGSPFAYVNERVASVPWSIHIVRTPRAGTEFTLHSVHAQGGALGLGTLSQQVRQLPAAVGTPVAAVNGDFYHRDQLYAGDPRGLQIVESELLSGPNGGVAFWVDVAGEPHIANIGARFGVTWPDGTASPFGLNEERGRDELVLYTPAIGPTTRTRGGREFVLQPDGTNVSVLRAEASFTARVREVSQTGDSALLPGIMVLSAGPALAKTLPRVESGSVVQLATTTTGGLRDAQAALSGGPVLVKNGKPQRIQPPSTDSYEFSSMLERHPRTAIGWDSRYFYMIQVDGRQKGLSMGMTLEELAAYMARLGCEEAMNLDGGGSATLWFEGQVRNRPCDGRERPIANALVISRKTQVEASSLP